ncbi:hypothetical protein LTR72_000731 [Exophiala xenobiotica]|nr:hypothetical protein LTR72_000731 [Exophiala xenobiotica]KAK5288447.1 hypothetical protein LTR14_008307 [Exophiala xenobiotica]KAK5476722.1 hypothetical protein LTR55_008777 [Exophiala xenobiotica]
MSLEVDVFGQLVLSYSCDEVGIWKVLRQVWSDEDLRTKETWNILAEQVRRLEAGRSRNELEQWVKEARALRATDPEDERQRKEKNSLNRRLEALRSILSSEPPRRLSHDQNPLFDSSKTTGRAKTNGQAQTRDSEQTAARIESAKSALRKPISTLSTLRNGNPRWNPRYPTRHVTSTLTSSQLASALAHADREETLFIPEAMLPPSIRATLRSNGGQNQQPQRQRPQSQVRALFDPMGFRIKQPQRQRPQPQAGAPFDPMEVRMEEAKRNQYALHIQQKLEAQTGVRMKETEKDQYALHIQQIVQE